MQLYKLHNIYVIAKAGLQYDLADVPDQTLIYFSTTYHYAYLSQPITVPDARAKNIGPSFNFKSCSGRS